METAVKKPKPTHHHQPCVVCIADSVYVMHASKTTIYDDVPVKTPIAGPLSRILSPAYGISRATPQATPTAQKTLIFHFPTMSADSL